jgi:hypothetical protein
MNHFALAFVALAATAVSQTYTVSTFGAQCGGGLAGAVLQTPLGARMHLGVTNADPWAHAVLVLGHQLPAPVQLPGGCQLLVEQRLVLHARTSGTGDVRFAFRLPPILPLTVDFQALIVTHAPTGRLVDATNGVRVVGV